MKCGKCKENHASVQEVKNCYGVQKTNVAVDAPREHKPSPVERMKEFAAMLPNVERAHYAVKILDYSDTLATDSNGDIDGIGEYDNHGHFKFFCVEKPQKGKWAGYTFVKKQAGSEYYKMSFGRSLAVIEAIAGDPAQALSDYGHELGQCGICNKTLTNPESIAAGIGPVCAGRL